MYTFLYVRRITAVQCDHVLFTRPISVDRKLVLKKRYKNKTLKMSSRKTKGKAMKKRAQRATSNVFAMFDQGKDVR